MANTPYNILFVTVYYKHFVLLQFYCQMNNINIIHGVYALTHKIYLFVLPNSNNHLTHVFKCFLNNFSTLCCMSFHNMKFFCCIIVFMLSFSYNKSRNSANCCNDTKHNHPLPQNTEYPLS